MHTLFNLFCAILTNPSMVNLTLVTYLLIELLTDTALSHVLFVLHVPTGITWFMGTDALQHRESIGRFYCLTRTVKNSKRLTLLEFIGIYLFAIHGIVALPITVFIFSFQYKHRVNLSGSTVQTSEQLVKSKSLEYVNNYAFLCIVVPLIQTYQVASVVSVQLQRL